MRYLPVDRIEELERHVSAVDLTRGCLAEPVERLTRGVVIR